MLLFFIFAPTGRTALHILASRQPMQAGDLAPYTEVLEDLFDRVSENGKQKIPNIFSTGCQK